MQKPEINIEKTPISYPSSNGKDTVQAWFYSCKQLLRPKAVVQISHGMCEYIARYDEFAAELVKNGFVVCGNDHLGHGETCGENGTYGFFAENDGAKHLIEDVRQLNEIAHKKYPGVKLFLLGHSMGSFIARKYATDYPKTIDGLIISGTSGAIPGAGFGVMLAKLLEKSKGKKYRSKFLNDLIFGAYNRKIKNPITQYDWVTDNKKELERYAADKKCTFIFTLSGFVDMISINRYVNHRLWAGRVRTDLPIYIFSGTNDPVGSYSKGVMQVYNRLKNAGVKDLELTLYKGGRHEMLTSNIRHEVFADVIEWLNARL